MIAIPAANGFERAGRFRKLFALVEVIDAACNGALHPTRDGEQLADTLAAWPDECWARAAVIAGIHPPSAVTRAALVDFYRSRAREASR